jgi:hypothetical protein
VRGQQKRKPLQQTESKPMTHEQSWKAAQAMSRGNYGSFAQSIGQALLAADTDNAKTLLQAFNGLFKRVSDDLDLQVLQDYMRVLLDHISADSPCSLEHVTSWAKSQGYGGSKMVQALHQLKQDNQIVVNADNTVELI